MSRQPIRTIARPLNTPVEDRIDPQLSAGCQRVPPREAVTSAIISGKRPLVFGLGFEPKAKTLLGGQAQKTTSDSHYPAGSLIGKKASKMIGQSQTVTLQVRNQDGAVSKELRLTRP